MIQIVILILLFTLFIAFGQTTALLSKKDSVAAIKAQGELKAIKTKQKSNKNGGSRKPRPSILGWLAFLIAPITYFLAGVPGLSQGAAAGGNIQTRLQRGLGSILLAYTGFNFNGQFFAKALLFGWLPLGAVYIARKLKINRMAPRGVPIIF